MTSLEIPQMHELTLVLLSEEFGCVSKLEHKKPMVKYPFSYQKCGSRAPLRRELPRFGLQQKKENHIESYHVLKIAFISKAYIY